MELYDEKVVHKEDVYYIKNIDSKTIIKINNLNEIDITPTKFIEMIAIYNFFQNKKFNKIEFKSLNHIGRTFEDMPTPSTFIKGVLSDMLNLKLIRINKDDKYAFDSERFEDLIEYIQYGKTMIHYVDNISAVRV